MRISIPTRSGQRSIRVAQQINRGALQVETLYPRSSGVLFFGLLPFPVEVFVFSAQDDGSLVVDGEEVDVVVLYPELPAYFREFRELHDDSSFVGVLFGPLRRRRYGGFIVSKLGMIFLNRKRVFFGSTPLFSLVPRARRVLPHRALASFCPTVEPSPPFS